MKKKILINNTHEYTLKIKSEGCKKFFTLKTTDNDVWAEHYQKVNIGSAIDNGDDIFFNLNGNNVSLDYLGSLHLYLLLKYIHENEPYPDKIEFKSK